MSVQYEIILIACLTAAACAIPGTFLVLRRMTMMSDAISHSILLGIVLAFFFVKQIDSPLLVVAAGMTGLLTVALVELVIKTQLIKEDAAIGVVYPLMFSVAVILISIYASHVHIDTDAVLMGELAFAPLNRLMYNGVDLGSVAVYQIGGMLVINATLATIFYKEIRLVLFDPNYAISIGFKPKYILYGIMTVVSFTIVVAFEVAGSIMVVGFIVGPALIATLFTKRLSAVLVLACLLGVLASVTGYATAHLFDVSIAGSITTVIGVGFLLVFLLHPNTGVISKQIRKEKDRIKMASDMLVVHLMQHEVLGDAIVENNILTLSTHLGWQQQYLNSILKYAESCKYITTENNIVHLLPTGKLRAQHAMER